MKIKRSAEYTTVLEDTWGKSFQFNENDLNLRILSWFYNSALFTTDCALSHLQLRNKGFLLEGRLPAKATSWILCTELIPFESVLCLNQSALIRCIICHIFTYLLVAVCIKGITSANKKSFTIYLTKLSWFSLQFLKSS